MLCAPCWDLGPRCRCRGGIHRDPAGSILWERSWAHADTYRPRRAGTGQHRQHQSGPAGGRRGQAAAAQRGADRGDSAVQGLGTAASCVSAMDKRPQILLPPFYSLKHSGCRAGRDPWTGREAGKGMWWSLLGNL